MASIDSRRKSIYYYPISVIHGDPPEVYHTFSHLSSRAFGPNRYQRRILASTYPIHAVYPLSLLLFSLSFIPHLSCFVYIFDRFSYLYPHLSLLLLHSKTTKVPNKIQNNGAPTRQSACRLHRVWRTSDEPNLGGEAS